MYGYRLGLLEEAFQLVHSPSDLVSAFHSLLVLQGYREQRTLTIGTESKATRAQVRHVGAEAKAHAADIETMRAQLRHETEERARQGAELRELRREVEQLRQAIKQLTRSPPSGQRLCFCEAPALVACPSCHAVFCKYDDALQHSGELSNHKRRPL